MEYNSNGKDSSGCTEWKYVREGHLLKSSTTSSQEVMKVLRKGEEQLVFEMCEEDYHNLDTYHKQRWEADRWVIIGEVDSLPENREEIPFDRKDLFRYQHEETTTFRVKRDEVDFTEVYDMINEKSLSYYQIPDGEFIKFIVSGNVPLLE